MPLFDYPLEKLRDYRPERDEPSDFDEFWRRTFDEAGTHPLAADFVPVSGRISQFDVFDVTFAGWGGDPIRAWLIIPKSSTALGCVVKYIGYGGGRGFAHSHLLWPAAGWAHLVVDTRGQGATSTGGHGSTGDPHGSVNPQAPGMLTKGVESPDTYYYRRVIADAMRAVDAAVGHPAVDAERIVTSGHSQGGALAQAVAAMHPRVRAALISEPFLNDFRRAAEVTSAGPYQELVQYLASQRDREAQTFRTLSYFDGVNFAARAGVPALYSVALMDTVCPPSTVFAAFNHWSGPKDIEIWPWNGHEGGENHQADRQLDYLHRLMG